MASPAERIELAARFAKRLRWGQRIPGWTPRDKAVAAALHQLLIGWERRHQGPPGVVPIDQRAAARALTAALGFPVGPKTVTRLIDQFEDMDVGLLAAWEWEQPGKARGYLLLVATTPEVLAGADAHVAADIAARPQRVRDRWARARARRRATDLAEPARGDAPRRRTKDLGAEHPSPAPSPTAPEQGPGREVVCNPGATQGRAAPAARRQTPPNHVQRTPDGWDRGYPNRAAYRELRQRGVLADYDGARSGVATALTWLDEAWQLVQPPVDCHALDELRPDHTVGEARNVVAQWAASLLLYAEQRWTTATFSGLVAELAEALARRDLFGLPDAGGWWDLDEAVEALRAELADVAAEGDRRADGCLPDDPSWYPLLTRALIGLSIECPEGATPWLGTEVAA